jgi:putative ABC transport system permease protein
MHSAGSPLTLLRMTSRNLYRRPMRTALTALGAGAGVIAIVAFTTLVQGLWVAVDDIVHFNKAQLMVFQANTAVDFLSILDEQETREKLLKLPGVTGAVGSLWHLLRVEDQRFCPTVGLRVEDMEYLEENLAAGHIPIRDDEMLLGSIAQRVFHKEPGDTLHIHGNTYRIAGIYHTKIVFFNSAVVLTLPRLQELAAKPGQVTAFQVGLEPEVDPDEAIDRIESLYPELVAIGSVSEYYKADESLLIAQALVWAISFVAVVIGALIVANTMWMAVMERTREIGVLRAVGWSRRRIVSMIISEATGVGLIACLIGCLTGCGLAELAASLPVAEMYLDPVFGVTPFLLALGVAVVLSVLGALLPAWRAAHISPAEALRYE